MIQSKKRCGSSESRWKPIPQLIRPNGDMQAIERNCIKNGYSGEYNGQEMRNKPPCTASFGNKTDIEL
ncbi:unnamed protein product [Blepharisma stoltei]|uniref:Uncharacterized protein n=1 Tax=Blepharisma stoltei TaxID=1481888 RepID=A0AAU9KCB2_9CILI|nr:unnamed protein product [Blepharisma stoltei]